MYTNFDYANEDGSFKKSFTRNVYDMNRQFIDVNFCMPNNPDKKLPQLNNFNKMIEISEKLAEDFVFLRVDLYNLDERIVVGELTFIPHGGVANITPIEYDYYWGEMLKLPNANI